MSNNLTDDQEQLRDSVARFLERQYDFAARRAILESGGFSPQMWQQFADLGWLGACIEESMGGYGGPVEAGVLLQALGRSLVLEPIIETAVVGSRLLATLAQPLRDALLGDMIGGTLQVALATTERRSRFDLADVETTAVPRGAGWALTGAKIMVANGDRADRVFVTARTGGSSGDRNGVSLFMLAADTPGFARDPFRTHDGRGAANIVLDSVLVGPEALVGEEGCGLRIVEAAIEHGCAALCAEAVGSCDHVLAATIGYLKTREQYGAPLAKLQVLQHRVAEMYVATEQARVMAGLATAALALDDAKERGARVDAARVAVIGYSRFVTQQAVQLHGGMGVSEELDIAHHLKRNMVAGIQLGNEAHHLERFTANSFAGKE